jgi:hypothetical protein
VFKAQDTSRESESGEVDISELFPKPVNKRPQAVMYNRALTQLKTILHNKGLKDSSVVINNGNFGLYHFHIDSADNKI